MPAGIGRVVSAVSAALSKASRLDLDQLFLFATSAVRDAANRDDVVGAIAAHRWYGWSAGRLLLLDIGGGSLEIALGRDAEAELAVSLPLGAGKANTTGRSRHRRRSNNWRGSQAPPPNATAPSSTGV